MPFLQKFALIVWVRIPPGTLSETVEQTDSPPVLLRNELTLTPIGSNISDQPALQSPQYDDAC